MSGVGIVNGMKEIAAAMLVAAPSRRRRRRRLIALFLDGLRARGEGASLVHVLWLFLASLAFVVVKGPHDALQLTALLALFASLMATSLFDAAYLIVPDRQIGVMLASAALFLTRFDGAEILAHIAAAAAAWGLLTLVSFAYERRTGRSGLGAGDAKLFGAAGLWLGPAGLPSCLLAAVASALVSAAIERKAGAPAAHEHVLPFGPHLALGLWLTLAFGPLDWI
ncbi:prepilin peptidase [Methylocystis heyeri]|uniref:Prepilin peptidase n=2 Tax=Methylocystis heyeri TaxID=391905 RepID=A0A6B8KEY4_9HYPH|nr:prepilin peptidase [Methylocystis heyeri]